MFKQRKWARGGIFGTAIMLLLSVIAISVFAQDEDLSEAPLMDDFEQEELFEGIDNFNNSIGHTAWGDTEGNVELSLVEMERDGETTGVLQINYDIGAWGGFTHVLNDGENWISQDWTAFDALDFWLFGSNTGGTVQVEIFDNRNPELNGDSAERWFYQITDDFEGWQQFTLPFDAFQRRSDFQPGGAPNDGLNLDAVSGVAFGMPTGTGAQTAFLDNLTVVTLDVQPLIVDDFEVEALFSGSDANGTDIGFVPFGAVEGNVELRLADAVRGGVDTRALTIDFDIEQWGGFSHVFTDGENWTPQDWSDYNTISFWYLGNNSGAEIQFEIFDNRAPESTGDSAERWFYRFVDDSFAWELIEIPLVDFQRREDFQPGGAPDDGFNLSAVHGYAFSMPAGIGDRVHLVDDMRMTVVAGVDMPEGVVAVVEETEAEEAPDVEAVTLPPVEPNADLLEPIPFAEPIMVADFNNGVPILSADGILVGFAPFGDVTGNTQLGIAQVQPFTQIALPEQSEIQQVFRIDYNISAYGGFANAFTDGENWVSQDWSNHNAMQFWLYGNNTGQAVMVELWDNRIPDTTGDTAERYFYMLVDDYDGWQQFTVPFAYFQRRTDFQPGPDDGFGLTEVNGYAFSFPVGVGAQTAYIEDVQVVVMDDPSQVLIDGEENVVTSIEIDRSITWDSREWDLLWSDEFDADAGTGINDEYWTCETGGWGWGNNELQYYTTDTENAQHDGDGNLVITAQEDETREYTSARCITQDKVEFMYGRVEARIQIPTGQGVWPAFWMLGAEFPQTAWPSSGEIDIMENVGNEPNVVHGTIHGPGYSGGQGIGNSYYSDEAFTDDFHVYAIDWDPYVIRWYVDGEMYGMVSVNSMVGRDWVFNQDFFLLMNVAVGGNWPGNPDETTEFPQEMLVDYVRVYQLAD